MKTQHPESLQNSEQIAIQHLPDQKALLFSWILSGLLIVISIVHYYFAQPELPIFYSLATKQDQVVDKLFVFLFPLLAITMAVTHTIISKALQEHSQIIIKLFTGTTLGLITLLFIAYIRIIVITL